MPWSSWFSAWYKYITWKEKWICFKGMIQIFHWDYGLPSWFDIKLEEKHFPFHWKSTHTAVANLDTWMVLNCLHGRSLHQIEDCSAWGRLDPILINWIAVGWSSIIHVFITKCLIKPPLWHYGVGMPLIAIPGSQVWEKNWMWLPGKRKYTREYSFLYWDLILPDICLNNVWNWPN